MNRSRVFVVFAFLGFLYAFALALPARSGTPAPAPAASGEFQVPLAWIAEALAQMPFVLPPAR